MFMKKMVCPYCGCEKVSGFIHSDGFYGSSNSYVCANCGKQYNKETIDEIKKFREFFYSNLENFEIVFENVENGTIPASYIKDFKIDGVTFEGTEDYNEKDKKYLFKCKFFYLLLDKEANGLYSSFEKLRDSKKGLLDRINAFNDIVYVEIHLKDKLKVKNTSYIKGLYPFYKINGDITLKIEMPWFYYKNENEVSNEEYLKHDEDNRYQSSRKIDDSLELIIKEA